MNKGAVVLAILAILAGFGFGTNKIRDNETEPGGEKVTQAVTVGEKTDFTEEILFEKELSNGVYAKASYVCAHGEKLFTVMAVPKKEGKFPVVVMRNPYDGKMDVTNTKNLEKLAVSDQALYYVKNGFGLVYQQCRGTGSSTGYFSPMMNERADGLALLDYIRDQSFYSGSIYLQGASYLGIVHTVLAPYADDIKGVLLDVTECNFYNSAYRNGFFKQKAAGEWYVQMHGPSAPKNNYSENSYKVLPFKNFAEEVFGEKDPYVDILLASTSPDALLWQPGTVGLTDSYACVKSGTPVLLVSRFYDLFAPGTLRMWREMDGKTKSKSSFVISPYTHGGTPDGQPVEFPNAEIPKAFPNYDIRWFRSIEYGEESPFEAGKVTYYTLFENKWKTDDFAKNEKPVTVKLGTGSATYTYDPQDPTPFNAALDHGFDGTAWQNKPFTRDDILTFYTDEFTEDTLLQGSMDGKLTVSSDCEDTCFYVRLSLVKAQGDYGLRDDIQQISNFNADYHPGEKLEIPLCFSDHSFQVKKGEKLRIDIASACFPHYFRHTNTKGLFSEQTETKIAHNTVYLDESYITYYTK